jgi:hypothetical protein
MVKEALGNVVTFGAIFKGSTLKGTCFTIAVYFILIISYRRLKCKGVPVRN